MILKRLYELAVREGLLDDLAFEEQPVPFIVNVGAGGKYLGVEERRGHRLLPSKKRGEEPRKVSDRGTLLAVPRPHGHPSNPGFARYFVDILARVLPITDDEKSSRSRVTFWQQMRHAAAETHDPALEGICAFHEAVATGKDDLPALLRLDLEKLKAASGDRCTFAWHEDQGKTLVEREAVRAWYRRFFESATVQRQQDGPVGICQVTGVFGPMPKTHPLKLSGIPDGLPTGVSVVSYDKPAFESYGWEGTANAAIGYAAADGYGRALTALIANRLPGHPRTSFRSGKTLFLFWTREPVDASFLETLDNPEPAEVKKLLTRPFAGKPNFGTVEPNAFYLLGLSANAARVMVREYLERPLFEIQRHIAAWFDDLTIADPSWDWQGQPHCLFPLTQLIQATALDSDHVAPDVPARLFRAALNSDPLPDSILAACIGRLRAEGVGGFRAARMALIKLILIRKDISVSETLNPNESHPAYVCGELLSVFEQIQYAALGKVGATIADKYYGSFSSAPGVVLGRLYANAQNHLRKLRGDKPGACIALDKRLTEVSGKLVIPPSGQLSLRDQARFALGYYHSKAKQFEEIAERKAAEAAAQ